MESIDTRKRATLMGAAQEKYRYKENKTLMGHANVPFLISWDFACPIKVLFSLYRYFSCAAPIKVALFLVSILFLPNFTLKFHFFNDVSHLLYIYLLFCNNNYK